MKLFVAILINILVLATGFALWQMYESRKQVELLYKNNETLIETNTELLQTNKFLSDRIKFKQANGIQ